MKKAKDKAAENLEVQKVMWMKDMDAILQAKAKEGGAIKMSASALMRSKDEGPPPLIAEESTLNKINSHMTELDVKLVHLKEIFAMEIPWLSERRQSQRSMLVFVAGCNGDGTLPISGDNENGNGYDAVKLFGY